MPVTLGSRRLAESLKARAKTLPGEREQKVISVGGTNPLITMAVTGLYSTRGK